MNPDETQKCVPNEPERQLMSCDQIAWLMDIFDRYLPPDTNPYLSQEREMRKYGMLYEVMEVARLGFKDDSARWNGTPNSARNYNEQPTQ